MGKVQSLLLRSKGNLKLFTVLTGIPGYVTVANLNSPVQTVISGEPDSVAAVLKRAEREEIQTRQLAVANAFHSEMLAEAAEYIRTAAIIPETLSQTSVSLLSSVNEH